MCIRDSYITLALQRFLNKTRCGIVKQQIAYDGNTSGYDLNYRPNRFTSIVLVPSSGSSGTETPFKQISYEDWNRFSDNYKKSANVCYVDNQASRIYFPKGLENGIVYCEYSIRATDVTAQAIIDNGIVPEEYHDAIADYCLFLAYRKDREFNIANSYFQSYWAVEQDAIREVGEKEVQPINDDWSTENSNPHRNSGETFQDMVEL